MLGQRALAIHRGKLRASVHDELQRPAPEHVADGLGQCIRHHCCPLVGQGLNRRVSAPSVNEGQYIPVRRLNVKRTHKVGVDHLQLAGGHAEGPVDPVL